MDRYQPAIEMLIDCSIPTCYTLAKIEFITSHWGDLFTSSSQLDNSMLFCQLISTVVHELPSNFSAFELGPPVNPQWACYLVDAQVRMLLGQMVDKRLCLEKVMTGEGLVPECIYLHGNPFESDGPGVSDHPTNPEESDEETIGDQDGPGVKENAVELAEPAEDLMARLSALEGGRVGLELTHESDWYITASDGMDAIESVQKCLIEHRAHQHPARVAYWKQLRESTVGDECVGLMTTHLWLSSLLSSPTQNNFYIDPLLLDQLVAQYKEDPLEMTADQVPLLFDRHKLWPQMGSTTVHILALAHVQEVCNPGQLNWLLMDIEAQDGRVKRIELILPPCSDFDNDAFADLISFFIGALNRVLPGPKLASNSARVQQRTMTLIIPEPFAEDSALLVLLAYLLGKMLGQEISTVDVKAMRQSICYYYNQALRSSEVDSSFPWPGLTNLEGKLLTEENSEEVGRRRFMLASNREPSPFEMFPRRRSYTATMATPGPSEPFFLELAQSHSSHAEGILVGTTGRSVSDLEKAILLGPYPSFKKKFPDSLLQVPEALSLEEYVQLVQDLGGPESEASHRLFLLAKNNGQRIKLDWLKDATYPTPEQMFAGFDLDSLSLSAHEVPELLQPGTYYPCPDHRFGLTTRNELYINLDGQKISMHTCPNFCIMTFGGNNQFRLLVFFPRNRNRVENLWRNMAREPEMQDWYQTFLTALRMVSAQVPFSWQHALEKTIEALPTTYRMASEQHNKGGGPHSSSGHRIEPFILNRVFKIMRKIIDSTPQLAKYRDYFFHLCGINLKLATMNIHGRMEEDPLKYALSQFNFIDWYAQNPHDIIADIGWTANINRGLMPDDLQNTTLVYRTDPSAELAQAAYRKPQIDRYCSSYVLGGWRSVPRASVREGCGVVKAQAYPKDMVLTYRHQHQSVGWNWTVKQGLRIGNRDKFNNQMQGFLNVMRDADSYGVRFEIRVPAWGANRVMKMDARDILDRLLAADIIVCYPTSTIAAFKSTLCRGWSAIINKQSQLAPVTRKSPEVVLLTSVLAHWIKSLIKRPDDQGASTQMVKKLQLDQTAKSYGIPSLRSAALDEDGLRVSYVVQAERFDILALSGLTVQHGPGAQDNNAVQAIPLPDPLQSPPPSPPRPLPANQIWPQSSQDFLVTLISTHLPRALWNHFPRDRLSGETQSLRLRKLPLQRKHWQKIVEPLNTITELKNKFSDSIDRLFPPNWTVTQPTGDLLGYNRDFLQRVRDHVNAKPAAVQTAYSSELRRRIRTMLMDNWDYLPNVHSHRIWAFNSGPAEQRIFRICPKSS
ncbi:hypothetical protein FRC11_011276 [Ceratobasidium sp. 423]|nr:hypothetical protein FRC11_011276 [Ceratobasidium sp. 423]